MEGGNGQTRHLRLFVYYATHEKQCQVCSWCCVTSEIANVTHSRVSVGAHTVNAVKC